MHVYIDIGIFKAAVINGPVSLDTFKVGMRVRITSGSCNCDGKHSYHGQYIGCEGEVIRMPSAVAQAMAREGGQTRTIGVLLDGKFNEHSQFGCYWFEPDELTIIETENNNMLLLKGYKIAQVNVEGYGEQYVAHYEETLGVGNKVIVSNDDDYHFGIVSNVFTEVCMNRVPKFQVVCKVDDSAYIDRCHKAQRARDLERKLNAAVADYQKVALFEMMAEKCPAVAELLTEYKELNGGNV